VPVPPCPACCISSTARRRATAPVAGKDTTPILAEHGFSAAEIKALLAQGAVAAPT